jgi:hypothetical protein
MAEPLRNEVTLTLAGEERTMRATFTALRSIEQALGVSIIKLIGRVASADMGLGDTATIIFHGLKGFGDTRLSLEEVGEAVLEAGRTNLIKPVMEYISKSMDGVKVGKPEAAAQ